MTRVVFLFDEHVPAAVRGAVLGEEPAVEITQVGVDPGVPVEGTLDPDLLVFAEAAGCAIVTFDKSTLRADADRHVASGRHTWGVSVLANGNDLSAGRVAGELLTVWGASDADEWIDRVEFLP